MRKLFIGVAAVALLALLAVPVMAVEPNPWSDSCDVDVEITIPEMAELWSNLGTGQERNAAAPPTLTVTNAGGIIPAEGIAQDTLNHLSNIAVTVSVELEGATPIPEWTRFHVLVAPSNRGSYNCVFAWGGAAGATFMLGSWSITNVNADAVITWDRRDSGTGYVGIQPDVPQVAFTGSATTNSVAHLVDYAVDAIHGMPTAGSSTPTVMWTIAPS